MYKCRKGYEVKVLKSNAGYYLGTLDKSGFPNCRVSKEYAETEEGAKNLTNNRVCIENDYCNEGLGCGIKEFNICPKCGKEYSERPALSRVDSDTEICPECGMREALEDAGIM